MKKIFSFFDYVYYRVCKSYKATIDSSPEFTAVCVISVIECLNLIFVAAIYAQIFQYWFTPNKLIAGLVVIIGIILNAIHYNKLNYDILKERWGNEDAKTQQRKGNGVLLYILLSIIAVIVVIIWRANTK